MSHVLNSGAWVSVSIVFKNAVRAHSSEGHLAHGLWPIRDKSDDEFTVKSKVQNL